MGRVSTRPSSGQESEGGREPRTLQCPGKRYQGPRGGDGGTHVSEGAPTMAREEETSDLEFGALHGEMLTSPTMLQNTASV